MAVDNISTNSHIINIFYDSHSSSTFKDRTQLIFEFII